MKKIFLLFLVFLLTMNISISEVLTVKDPEIHKIVIFKNGEADANKILYDFALEEMYKNNWPVGFTLENVFAYKVDLEDNAGKAIVGVVFDSGYTGSSGYKLFILKKYENKYKDISSTSFWPWSDFKILKKKVNGFHVIEIKKTNGEPRYLEFDKKYYN